MANSKAAFILSLLIFLCSNFILPLSAFAQTETEETLTFTTYYPAPYGVYNEMRLFPHTPPSGCDSTKTGTMYYDSNEDQTKVCTKDGWKNIGGAAGKTLVDFGQAAIYLSDGAEISGNCGNLITGSARYFNGKIQTRASGFNGCDSDWVDGYSAECKKSGLIVTVITNSNGVSGYSNDIGYYPSCADPPNCPGYLSIQCNFPTVAW